MEDYAKYKIGETLYDRKTGQVVGKISAYYRYHAGRDDCYDTSMSVDYRFTTPSGYGDNTSRQGGPYGLCNAEELKREFRGRLSLLADE